MKGDKSSSFFVLEGRKMIRLPGKLFFNGPLYFSLPSFCHLLAIFIEESWEDILSTMLMAYYHDGYKVTSPTEMAYYPVGYTGPSPTGMACHPGGYTEPS